MTDSAPLRMPAYLDWPLFPFDGELTIRQPINNAGDPPRAGEPGGSECHACLSDGEGAIWSDDHWIVRPPSTPASIPALVFLESRAHVDLDGLPDERAAEMGLLIVRLDRAMQAIGDIGRVHACRWGDGGSHFHMWFFARPRGSMNLLGFGMPFWEPVLPPLDQETWDANLQVVARELAKSGGTAHV
jgi:diadenosine tetraphosphate (Ap4A) HIT family hydrolase